MRQPIVPVKPLWSHRPLVRRAYNKIPSVTALTLYTDGLFYFRDLGGDACTASVLTVISTFEMRSALLGDTVNSAASVFGVRRRGFVRPAAIPSAWCSAGFARQQGAYAARTGRRVEIIVAVNAKDFNAAGPRRHRNHLRRRVLRQIDEFHEARPVRRLCCHLEVGDDIRRRRGSGAL